MAKYTKRKRMAEGPVKGGKIDLTNPIFYRDLHRYISRYWKCHMSAAEYSVLDMVFDRTIGWGKLWEAISFKQIKYGVWNEKMTASDGTGLSKRTAQRAIEALVAMGVLVKRQGRLGSLNSFAINILWTPPELEYLEGRKTYSPRGAKRYWHETAAATSKEAFLVVQRKGEAFYAQYLDDEQSQSS